MPFPFLRLLSQCLLAAGLFLLTACQGVLDLDARANAPVPKKLIAKMKAKNMSPAAPIMMRVFKDEDVLEVWKQKRNGKYALLTSYDICKWSGKLGPKFKEGDRQAPEGFYTVNTHQMNPKSSYHLSFNIGFPNAYDRAHGRTGRHLMVHGACSSAGCYSMNDDQVQEIYALAREAFKGGQKRFQFQAYPFRMTPKNMAKHHDNAHFAYWQMLKRGYDHFELTKVPPKVDVCEKRYVFNTQAEVAYKSRGTCPPMTMPDSLADRFVALQTKDAARFAKTVPKAKRATLPDVTRASILGPINAANRAQAKAPQPKGKAATDQDPAPRSAQTPADG